MGHLRIDLEKCIGCGKCAKMCLKDHIVIENKKAKELDNDCLECSHCVSTCPKGAITLIPSSGDGGIFSEIKKDKMFDGGMVSDEDLNSLYSSMKKASNVEVFTLQGKDLDMFMEDVWTVINEKELDTPIVKEWAKWRSGHSSLEPNPVLWEGKQVLFIFSDGIDRAVEASNRMIMKGFELRIRGFHSNIIMSAVTLDRERFMKYFPGATKEMRMSYVIGHPRRFVEPVFKPMKKIKGIFDKI